MLSESDGAKGRGNEQFKLGKYLWAADHYTEAIEISEPGRGTPDIRAARAIYFSNRAQARIKMVRAAAAAAAPCARVPSRPTLRVRHRSCSSRRRMTAQLR